MYANMEVGMLIANPAHIKIFIKTLALIIMICIIVCIS